MTTLANTQRLRHMLITEERTGLPPAFRRRILESFLNVRKSTAERVEETDIQSQITVTTHTSFDSDGMRLCEDIFVAGR